MKIYSNANFEELFLGDTYGENGFLAKGFETEDLYASVKEAVEQASSISRDMIIQEYETNYSIKTCARKYYDEYERLCK